MCARARGGGWQRLLLPSDSLTILVLILKNKEKRKIRKTNQMNHREQNSWLIFCSKKSSLRWRENPREDRKELRLWGQHLSVRTTPAELEVDVCRYYLVAEFDQQAVSCLSFQFILKSPEIPNCFQVPR